MTCNNCRKHVIESLSKIENIKDLTVNLESKKTTFNSDSKISLNTLTEILPTKYSISEYAVKAPTQQIEEKETKWKQLKPLFLILGYILVGSLIIHRNNLIPKEIMLDFMGLFFIVFSFFKMLDLKGFASSFQMYDPVSKAFPSYGLIYPFIETALGIMFLIRWNITIAFIITIAILGITTIGVTKALLSKNEIKCACLGTALNLPMTEATIIENAIMIIMSIVGLFQL